MGLVPASGEDAPILSAPCRLTQAKGDMPLSHVLDQIPLLPHSGGLSG